MKIIDQYNALLDKARDIAIRGKYCEQWRNPPTSKEFACVRIILKGETATLLWMVEGDNEYYPVECKFPAALLALSGARLERAIQKRLADLEVAATEADRLAKSKRRRIYEDLKKEFEG